MPSGTEEHQNSDEPFLQKCHLGAGGIPAPQLLHPPEQALPFWRVF